VDTDWNYGENSSPLDFWSLVVPPNGWRYPLVGGTR